jgi:phosphoribosylformimino-5-aminoimidazole carboxamide ribonucleotide (ProFAR) isomerase
MAVRGWEEHAGADLLELAARFEHVGVAALVVTEIGRDGTMEGPSLDQLRSVLQATTLPVIASGGVGSLTDLGALAGLQAGDRRLAGAIAGRAIYEGRFTVAEALATVRR